MNDLGFVAAAYLVILGGMAAYAWQLVRRLRRATEARALAKARQPAPHDG